MTPCISEVDFVGLQCPLARRPLGGGGTGRAHGVGRICRLVGVLNDRGLGHIQARSCELLGGVDGAYREVYRFNDGQVEVVSFLEGRGGRPAHFVMDGRMLACPVGSRAGDVAQVGQHSRIKVNGTLQIERYFRA